MGKQQISIPLDIADVNVLSVEFRGGAYHIKLESSLEYAYCRQCGQRITALHEREDWVKVQHLPILDRAVFLYYRAKRYRCPDCQGGPTTTQRLSWHEPNSPHTVAYDRYLLRMLVNSTLEDVTHKACVSYDSMVGVVERCVATAVDWERYSDLNVLGLDEIALKKGQRDYVVIVSTRQKAARWRYWGYCATAAKRQFVLSWTAFPHGCEIRLRPRVVTCTTAIYKPAGPVYPRPAWSLTASMWPACIATRLMAYAKVK